MEIANAGITHNHIANHYNMPRSTVSNIIRRSRLAPTTTIQKRGRKDKLTNRDVRSLLNYARHSRFKPLHTIVAEFTADTVIEISKNTAGKYLNQSNIRSYVTVSKPY